MKIDICILPRYLNQREKKRLVVVVDVLRASSTIVTALANKASFIIPFSDISSAREYRKKFGRKGAILCGERDGRKIKGFNLGNSPLEFTSRKVKGKVLLMSSTNGTIAINAVKDFSRVIIGCFLNLSAIVETILLSRMDIVILCAGTHGKFSLEDFLFAGAIINEINNRKVKFNISDICCSARDLYEHNFRMLEQAMRASLNGRILLELDMADDIKYCATRDRYAEMIPELVLSEKLVSDIHCIRSGQFDP